MTDVYIRVAIVAVAIFLIVWGRHRETTEAWIARLPMGSVLLKALDYIDSIICPKDDRLSMVRRFISEISALMRERPKEDQLPQFEAAVRRKIRDQAREISLAFGDAAKDMFLDQSEALAHTQPGAINDQHAATITNLEAFRKNLRHLLINPDKWSDKA